MKGAVYSSRSALYTGLFENGVRRAEKGAECELHLLPLVNLTYLVCLSASDMHSRRAYRA